MSPSTPAPKWPFWATLTHHGRSGNGHSGQDPSPTKPDPMGLVLRHKVVHTIPPDPYYLPRVRAFARNMLVTWEIPEETIEIAETVVSELATNAIVHSQATAQVRLIRNGLLRIEVADSSHRPPRMRPAPRGARDHGLGLVIVDHVAARWGHRLTATGKDVWCELPLYVYSV
jgi:anti-sigma regulatory factor (Ser/Thr protein kinase)